MENPGAARFFASTDSADAAQDAAGVPALAAERLDVPADSACGNPGQSAQIEQTEQTEQAERQDEAVPDSPLSVFRGIQFDKHIFRHVPAAYQERFRKTFAKRLAKMQRIFSAKPGLRATTSSSWRAVTGGASSSGVSGIIASAWSIKTAF